MLEIKQVSKTFKQGMFRSITAVDNISLRVASGEILGIAGNSGCGKSTLARLMVGLQECSSGAIWLKGRNIKTFSRRELSRTIQIIFQHPVSSFDPKMRLGDSFLEPMLVHRLCSMEDARLRVKEIINLLGLSEVLLERYPHQISGGEAQRMAIGRALSLQPEIIVLDEPTSMLDVSVQAGIFQLLMELKQKLNLTYIIISHDLEVLSRLCDTLAIMNSGKLVDYDETAKVLNKPRSEYTRVLIENFQFFGN